MIRISAVAIVALVAAMPIAPARADTAWWTFDWETGECRPSAEGPLGLRAYLRITPGDEFESVEAAPSGYATLAKVTGSIQGKRLVWLFFRNRLQCEWVGHDERAKLRSLQ
jgi:hypothetical protein